MAGEKQPETTTPPATSPEEPGTDAEQIDSEFPEETWVTDEDWVDDINVRWRKVIDELMNGAKIYDAYAKAYDIETSTPKGYNLACACGSRLLRNDNFKKLWNKVLEEHGFNDQAADMQLIDLMTNPSYEPNVRRAAVKDYNELRGRIIKNVDVKSGGKPIQAPAVISSIEPRDALGTETEAAQSS